MLPGRVYTFDDIAVMIRRRLWLLILPVLVFGAGTIAVLDKIPDKYRADTLILVIPQRVPESYVRSTITSRIEDRLESIRQLILSRTRLEALVQDYLSLVRVGAIEPSVQDLGAAVQEWTG